MGCNLRYVYQLSWNVVLKHSDLISFTFLSLNFLQLVLLHPHFQSSLWARHLRFNIFCLSLCWWTVYPFISNPHHAGGCAVMIMKATEWGCDRGPYRIRPSAVEKDKFDAIRADEDGKVHDLLDWTLTQLSSLRGLRCSWGPKQIPAHLPLRQSLFELCKNQLLGVVSLGFLVAVRDSPEVTPHSALLSLGLPRFPGLVILAQCIHTLAFGMAISTCMDAYILTWASIAHLIHPICLCLGLPRSVSEFFNPIWYPPWFNQLLESNSVAQFWNKSWHQLLKRGFVCCGGKPGVNLARLLGLRPQAQRIVGLFGIFAASGLYHEYGVYTMGHLSHSDPYIPFKTFPGTFLFFFLQPLGIILEPYIIPYIPTRFGSKLWTYTFLLLTCPLFANVLHRHGSWLSSFKPISDWGWLEILTPVYIFPHLIESFKHSIRILF